LGQLRDFFQQHLAIHDEVETYEPLPLLDIQQRFNRLVKGLEAHPHQDQELADVLAQVHQTFQQHIDRIAANEQLLSTFDTDIQERQRFLADSDRRYAQLHFELFSPQSPTIQNGVPHSA
jgi:hypothetical protein